MFYRERYKETRRCFTETLLKTSSENIPSFNFQPFKPSMLPAVRPSYSLVPAAPDLTINIFLFLIVKFNDYEEIETVYIIIAIAHGVNAGVRYYDPTIGRFISADTHVDGVFSTQGYNRYTYCGNNPIRYNDPSGHDYDPFSDASPEGDNVTYIDSNGNKTGQKTTTTDPNTGNKTVTVTTGHETIIFGVDLGWSTDKLTSDYYAYDKKTQSEKEVWSIELTDSKFTITTFGENPGDKISRIQDNSTGKVSYAVTIEGKTFFTGTPGSVSELIEEQNQNKEFLNAEIQLYNGKTYIMGRGQHGDTGASDCIGDVAGTIWALGYHIPIVNNVGEFLNLGVNEGWLSPVDADKIQPGNIEFMYYNEDGKWDWNHVLTIGDNNQTGERKVFSAYGANHNPGSDYKDTLNQWNSYMAAPDYFGKFNYMQINWGILNQYYPKQ